MKKITFTTLLLCSSLLLSAQVIKSVQLTAAGNLATDLTNQGVDNTVTDLTVTTASGVYMTSTADFTTLNNLPNLQNLDMSGAYTAATGTGTLPASAFYNNTHLKTFIFPKNVKNIGSNALTGCTGLTGPLTIPATVNGTANLKGRMDNMPGITAFVVESGSTTLKSVDGVIYSYDGTILALYPGGKTASSYNIVSGTTTVYDGAFAYVQNLQALNIPSSVTAFGTASTGTTFYVNKCCIYSPSLQTITVDAGNANFTSMNGTLVDKTSGWNYIREFPEGYVPQELTVDGTVVQKVQGNIFSRAKNLKYVKFGEGITTLTYQTFKPKGITPALVFVELPTTLTSLGNEVFNGTTSLKQIVFKSSTPPTIGTNAFGSVSTQSDVLVGAPSANLTAYQTTGTGTLITTGGFTVAKIVASRAISGTSVTFTPSFLSIGIPSKIYSIVAAKSYRFANWTSSPANGTFGSTTSSSTTYTMPNYDETLTPAYYNTYADGVWSNVSTDPVVVSSGELTIDQDVNESGLTVSPGAKLTVASGKTLTASTLTLNSDASGTGTFVNNGTANVTTANVNQYLVSGRNWYISSPISNATNSNLSTTSNVVYWDEPTAAWVQNYTGSLAVGKGYISAATSSTGNITFSGTLNDGAESINLTRTTGQSKEGFNLIGNPYPSYVNWVSATKTNVDPTIWYRTKNLSGTYVFDTFNGVGTNNNGSGAVTGLIPPMQAVWVRVDAGQTTGSIVFNNSMRSHASGSTTLLKAPAQVTNKILRLEISNGVNSDEALVYFNPNAINTFDNYDSEKMSNNNVSIPEIYTVPIQGAEALVINGLNSVNTVNELPIGFTTGETNNFTIKASEVSNFDAGTQVILKDNLLGRETDLTVGNSYSFASDATSTADRFSVLFRTSGVATGVNNTNSSNNFVYANGNLQIGIYSKDASNGKVSVSVFNALGRKIAEKILNATSSYINVPEAGLYMISINNNKVTSAQKVMVK